MTCLAYSLILGLLVHALKRNTMLLPYSFLICVLFLYHHSSAANEQEDQIPLEYIISMSRAHLKGDQAFSRNFLKMLFF